MFVQASAFFYCFIGKNIRKNQVKILLKLAPGVLIGLFFWLIKNGDTYGHFGVKPQFPYTNSCTLTKPVSRTCTAKNLAKLMNFYTYHPFRSKRKLGLNFRISDLSFQTSIWMQHFSLLVTTISVTAFVGSNRRLVRNRKYVTTFFS